MRLPRDLTPYNHCDDHQIGIVPLAVGWLHRRYPFDTSDKLPNHFITQLKLYCHPSQTINQTPKARLCPLCNGSISLDGTLLGAAEIRVLGEEDIFASPDLIYHYVTVHHYRPPQPFIDAVIHGVAPGTGSHRTLINTLRQL